MTAPARLVAVSRGGRLALGLLTVTPVRAPAVEVATARAAMLLAPAVGVLLWLVVAAVTLGVRVWLSFDFGAWVPAAFALATLALLTRGLHLDGLADTADALASYRPPEQAREVMRRGDVGPAGVAAVVLVLLMQASLLEVVIFQHHGTVGLFVALLSGRLAITVSCARGIPVLPGSRLGALVVGTVPRWSAAVLTLAVAGAAAVAAQLDPHTGDRGTETWQALAAPLAALLVTWPLRRHVVRRLGGVGGDALGAQCEIATLVALLVLAGRP